MSGADTLRFLPTNVGRFSRPSWHISSDPRRLGIDSKWDARGEQERDRCPHRATFEHRQQHSCAPGFNSVGVVAVVGVC